MYVAILQSCWKKKGFFIQEISWFCIAQEADKGAKACGSFSMRLALMLRGLRGGGYKAYRAGVLNTLALPPTQSFVTLYGMTGCGKSELVKKADSWAIDLEGFCKHYGSSFGDEANRFQGQPTQAMFENQLFEELRRKRNPSNRGGIKKARETYACESFFDAMHSGVKILVVASMELRIQRIVKMYSQIKEEHFFASMESIRPYMERRFFQEVLGEWEHRNYQKSPQSS